MKRLLAAGILLFSLAVLVIASRITTEYYCDSFDSRVTLCESEYKKGNKKTAAKIAADIKTDWDNAHFKLAAFTNREAVDEIELSVARLASLSLHQNDELFYSECTVIHSLLHHLLENERFTLLSVF